MTKDILNDLIAQNQKTCDFTFNEITQENSALKLNDDTASVGFIYRHIGEIMHLLAQFLGFPTDVENLSEKEWKETLDTPFFGTISRVRLLGHILYHTTYHCGQITLTLKRGK